MKKLILRDHQGKKLLEFDVFVEGQDFHWSPLRPTAFWLGEIILVDREPEPEVKVEREIVTLGDVLENLGVLKKDESEEVDNQATRDSRVSEANESEGIERLFEKPTGGESTSRGKGARKRKAA